MVKSAFQFRLVYRSLLLRRRRLSVALLALAVGATLASALLGTYADLEQKMGGEFRRYGANLLVAPAQNAETASETMPADSLARVESAGLKAAPFLYVLGRVNDRPVVLAGADFQKLRAFSHGWQLQGKWPVAPLECLAGERLGLRPGDRARATLGSVTVEARVSGVVASGTSEDSQLLLPLWQLQQMSGLEGRLSLVEANAPVPQVEAARARLAAALPGSEVRVLRPVAESAARVLLKVRGMLFATSVVVLAIIALGVMTTFSAIVLERRKDIGVMKALGAGHGQMAALFLAESAMLGLAAGLAGHFAGLGLARWISHSIYSSAADASAGVAVAPALLAKVLLVTVAVALAATVFPLRMVRGVNPAAVLKGE